MRMTGVLLAGLVCLGFAATIEVGNSEYPSNMPFCAD